MNLVVTQNHDVNIKSYKYMENQIINYTYSTVESSKLFRHVKQELHEIFILN